MPDGSAVAGMHGTARSPRTESQYTELDETRGFGWIIFAGVLIGMAGVINLIYGIAAIAESQFYVLNTHFVVSSLKTWGWVVTIIGAIQICVAVGVWMRSGWARWTGVAIASLNAIAQLMFIPAYPWLSLAIFTMDILVIYGLVSYGKAPATER